MAEPFKLGEIRGEVTAISCGRKFNLEAQYATNQVSVRPNLGSFGVSVKKEDEQSNRSRGITVRCYDDLRQHVFKKVWERNIDPNPRLVGQRTAGASKDSYVINWKQWPPPIPEIVPGLKIPVVMVPQIDYRLSQTGLWREVNSGTEAKPLDPETSDFFDNVNGSLNTPQSKWFSISPPSLLFLNSKMGEFYQVTLKLRNIGHIPRRIRVIPPYSKSFEVLWGSDLEEKTLISPGLTTRVVVQFKPANNNAINDILMVVIDGDGALIVPMMSTVLTPPMLETIEWNIGCSAVGNERSKCFELKNIGGDARFWILSEAEFEKEYLAVFREFEKKRSKKMSEELTTGKHSGCKIKTKFKLDQVYTRCFRLFPSSFRLQRNQKIEIKIRYQPKEANFHYEKLALLCDNGEVRWIAMRGMGLDAKSPGILELSGKWSAPPCDLPSDINANYIIDCGDLIPGETASPTFSITNKSCLPMYFFWCLRPIQSVDGGIPHLNSKSMLQHQFEGTLLVDQKDYDMKMANSRPMTPANQIKIFPAQGIIEGNQEIVCTIKVDCPQGTGYHSGILSIFVEQVNDSAKDIIQSMVKDLEDAGQNDIPMDYQDLIQTMPEIPSLKEKQADLYHHFHSRSNKYGVKSNQQEENKNDPEGHPNYYGEKNKRKFGSQRRKSSQTPIFLMKRRSSHDLDGVSFQLTQLQIQGDAVVDSSNEITDVVPGGQGSKKENETPQPEDVPVKSGPKDICQKLMERQQKLEDAQKTGNFEVIRQIMQEMMEDSYKPHSKPEEKPASIEDKPASIGKKSPKIEGKRTETEGEEEVAFEIPKNLSEGKKGRSEREEVSRSRREGGSLGGVTEEMLDYIRRSLQAGPKTWLKDTSALMPVKEVEIWMRSLDLRQLWFYPPFIVATGPSGWEMQRTVQFHNQSKHPVEVEWEKFMDDVCCISCDPQVLVVKSLERSAFLIKIQLQNSGKLYANLNGTMRLPFSTFACSIALDITTSSPTIEILTPLLSFGLLTFGTEKVKSLAIKNTGIKRAKWRARLAEDAMENEKNQLLAKYQTKMISGQLLRVWPQWGVLDPGEVTGAQVYFSAEVHGRVATSIEIIIDENPNLTTYVTVCAEVQTPCLFFENGFFAIPTNIFEIETSYKSNVKINNPTGFYLAFSWQCPIGRQNKTCQVDIEPHVGFVGPKSSTECQVTVTNPEHHSIHNLFVPCCVEGMKEPLVLKIFSTNS